MSSAYWKLILEETTEISFPKEAFFLCLWAYVSVMGEADPCYALLRCLTFFFTDSPMQNVKANSSSGIRNKVCFKTEALLLARAVRLCLSEFVTLTCLIKMSHCKKWKYSDPSSVLAASGDMRASSPLSLKRASEWFAGPCANAVLKKLFRRCWE